MINMKKLTACILSLVMLVLTFPTISVMAAETITSVPGWTITTANAASTGYVDNENSVGGNGSLKLINNPEGTQVTMAVAMVSVKAGQTYKLDFYAKAKNANNAFVKFNWDNNNLVPFGTTYDWTNFKLSYVAKESGTLYIRIGTDAKTDGLWVDNICLYDIDDPAKTNLISNGTFETGGGKALATGSESSEDSAVEEEARKDVHIYTKKNINLDGDFSDWNDIIAYNIPIVQSYTGEPPENPLSGTVQYAYDDENFYYCIKVNDVSHHPAPSSRYWEGDNVQMGIAKITDGGFSQMGVTYWEDGDKIDIIAGEGALFADAIRKGTTTSYEIAVPWKSMFEAVPETFKFNAIINNNNGSKRDHGLEIAHGISLSKDVSLHRTMYVFFPVDEDVSYVIDCAEYEPDTTSYGKIMLYNSSDAAKTVQIESKKLNLSKKVSVPAKQETEVPFEFSLNSGIDETADFELLVGEKKSSTEKKIKTMYSAQSYPVVKEKIENYAKELEELLVKCDKKGISTDYEKVNYSVIVRFLEQMQKEADHDYYALIGSHYEALTEIYNEAKTALESYLKGEKTPFKVPKYVTSDISIENYGLKATTYDGTDYEKNTPVFFIGAGHPLENESPVFVLNDELPLLSGFGFKHLESGVPVREFYFEATVPTARRIAKWKVRDGGKGTTGYTVSDEESYSGGNSLKITRTEPWGQGSYRYIDQTLSVKPNTTYVIGAKVKAEESGGMYFWFGKNDGVKKGAGTYDWTDISFEYTTSDMESKAVIQILVDMPAKSLYFDDIYVIEKGTDVNLIEDSSFEKTAKINAKTKELVENDEYLSKLRAEALEEGWDVDYYAVMELIDFLKNAEKNNFLVTLMMDISHITGTFIMQTEPGMADGYHRFLPYLIDHPKVKKALRIYTQTVLHMVKDCKSVYQVGVANEPSYDVRGGNGPSVYYLPEWYEYLKGIYGSIEKLNEVYGSNYQSFEEVEYPKQIESTPLFYDWRCFNDDVLVRFIQDLFDDAREVAPNLKYSTKVMNYMRKRNLSELTFGTDYERLAGMVDINGNDAIARQFNHDDYRVEWSMLWYDFQSSLSKAPVANNENHVILDTNVMDLSEQWSPWVTSQIWNGAVHRMGLTSIWMWVTDDNQSAWNGSWSQTNFTVRARDLADLGRTTLDINRLAKEITAIQNVEPDTAVLYSRTTDGYNNRQNEIRSDAYAELLYNGQKVGFVTDTTSGEMGKYKLVVIPESTNVSKEVLDNILSYLKNGGRVLVVGDTSLKKDEHNIAHDEAIVNEIYSLATVVSLENMKDGIENAVQAAELDTLILKDAETGERIDKTEWAYAEYDGNIVVNILNYEWSDKTVKLEYKGNEIHDFTELRSGEKYENTITLSPYVAALIQFSK